MLDKENLKKLAKTGDYHGLVVSMKRKRIDINQLVGGGRTALHVAAQEGHVAVVAALILNGADLNPRSFWDVTPLYEASAEGHTAVVTLLLYCGADPLIRARSGLTALHKAAEFDRSRTLAVLLRHPSVIPDCKCAFGSTPLIFACCKNNRDVAHMLLEAGASPSLRSANSSLTPLQVASLHSSSDVVSELLLAGADPNEGQGRHPSSLHLAVRNIDPKCVKLLLAAGARTGDVFGLSLLQVLWNSPHQSLLSSEAEEVQKYLNSAELIRADAIYFRRFPLVHLRLLFFLGRVHFHCRTVLSESLMLPDICFQCMIKYL